MSRSVMIPGPEASGSITTAAPTRRCEALDGRLPLEAKDEIGVLGRLVVEHLEGDLLARLGVRGIDLPHAALPDEPPDAVQAPH